MTCNFFAVPIPASSRRTTTRSSGHWEAIWRTMEVAKRIPGLSASSGGVIQVTKITGHSRMTRLKLGQSTSCFSAMPFRVKAPRPGSSPGSSSSTRTFTISSSRSDAKTLTPDSASTPAKARPVTVMPTTPAVNSVFIKSPCFDYFKSDSFFISVMISSYSRLFMEGKARTSRPAPMYRVSLR